MTKYLKRFISLRVRKKLTLKERGDTGVTLFDDYYEVYRYLIDLIRAGFRLRNKILLNDDAHQALRIVWGRTRQFEREEKRKISNKEKKKKNSKKRK